MTAPGTAEGRMAMGLRRRGRPAASEERRELRRHRSLADRRVARGPRRPGAPLGADERGGRGAAGSSPRDGRIRGIVHRRGTTESSPGGEAVSVSAPQPMGYGGTDAVVENGCGNLLNLHQD
jgi:hypothetical protein